jgi:hypothetical protein
MTEITVNKNIMYPKGKPHLYMIDPVALALALVGGPLVVGVLGAPGLLIPSIAAVFGGPIYVLAGTPVMLWRLARNRSSTELWVGSALLTHLTIFVPLTLAATAQGRNFDGASVFLIFGCLFAPLWGLISAAIYKRCERDFYQQAL